MTSLNSLNFDRRFSIQKMIDICKGISIEDQRRDEKIKRDGNKSYNIDRSKIYLINLILRLKKLSKFNDTYFTDNKKLINKYIRDRVSTLIGIYANNMINNSDINFIDVYNFLGILAIIMINQNYTGLYSVEFTNYIKKIMAEDINESRKILVVFLYKFNEYIATLSKNSPDYNKYNSFILTYKKILFGINSKFMTSTRFNSLYKELSNFKKIFNANTKEQLNIIAAQNKAKANAKEAQNKAKANAIAAQNKAKANAIAAQNKAKAEQNKKCINQWGVYKKYKKENPFSFKVGVGRPNRPTCGEQFRFSNKNSLNTNITNIANNSYSNNLKNNTRNPIRSQ
jgi:hypothetical protein